MAEYPKVRMRRIRQTAALRSLYGLDFPRPSRLIWPVFVVEGEKVMEPIKSLPGQYYYSTDRLIHAVEAVHSTGVVSVLVFGLVEQNRLNSNGEYSYCPDGPAQRALSLLRKEFPKLALFADTGLSGYTNHGHAGIINDKGVIDNDATLEVLKRIALSQVAAGATGVAPSGMIDGQVAFLRAALDEANFHDALILSYSTKFHSCLYDPFPYAVRTPRKFDPRVRTYLAPPNDTTQAVREAMIDEAEGADMVMVKPALFYLDIIASVRSKVSIPLVAYNVSGEYAMIQAAAKAGMGALYQLAGESIMSIYRAGADSIITYWANQYTEIKKEVEQ